MSVQQFAFPMTLAGTDFAYTEQDSVAEIRDCVRVLLGTPVGSRVSLPTYGAPDVLFSQIPIAAEAILSAIREWEPRANVTIEDAIDIANNMADHVSVTITGGAP